MHFITEALSKGFKSRKEYSPKDNWFGVSVYHPDLVLEKDNKKIILSLQGTLSKWNDAYKELFDTGSVKYICLKENDKIIYENWTGIFPDNNFLI